MSPIEGHFSTQTVVMFGRRPIQDFRFAVHDSNRKEAEPSTKEQNEDDQAKAIRTFSFRERFKPWNMAFHIDDGADDAAPLFLGDINFC